MKSDQGANRIRQLIVARLLNAPGMNLTPRCYLQLYLAYAQAVSKGDENQIEHILDRLSHAGAAIPAIGNLDSPLEGEVLRELERLGYQVDCQVGESGFRIDLAVRHPIPNQGYLLGIECDGATYHGDRAAHLRDVWRETILRERGWKIHRIWSTRWWYHRAEEIAKLEHALSEASLQLAPAMPPVTTTDAARPQPAPPAGQPVAQTALITTTDPGRPQPLMDDAQVVQEAPVVRNQAEPPVVGEHPAFPANNTDQDLTLGQIRAQLTTNGEFTGSWELFLDFMNLPRGQGLRANMTLAEARQIAGRAGGP